MQKPFSAGADKLFSVMAQMSGWTPEQFWNATPAELVSIFDGLADNIDGNQSPLSADQMTKLKDKYPDG